MKRLVRDATDDETGSERTCIVTRARLSPDEMLRFVAGPDGLVVADIKRKLPGRGVWVSADAKNVAEAAKKQLFARSLKCAVKASPQLADEVDAMLERDALQFFSIANKAGLVVTGSAKVESAIAKGGVIALIHATDGGADGIRKLGQAVTRRFGEAASGVPRIALFQSAQLDLALGRANVIHAALMAGPASDALPLAKCRRLDSYRSGRQPGNLGEPASPANLPEQDSSHSVFTDGSALMDDKVPTGHQDDKMPDPSSGDDTTTSGLGPEAQN